jgi:hypothetical protein
MFTVLVASPTKVDDSAGSKYGKTQVVQFDAVTATPLKDVS